nr:hypothetical protein [Streptomyces sabulosicollis]
MADSVRTMGSKLGIDGSSSCPQMTVAGAVIRGNRSSIANSRMAIWPSSTRSSTRRASAMNRLSAASCPGS